MNVTRMLFVFFIVLNACGSVVSKAIPSVKKAADHKISKRSADHNIQDKKSREIAKLQVQLWLSKVLHDIDTSGEVPEDTASGIGSGFSATSTTKTRNSHRNKPRKGGKGRKNKRRGRRNRSKHRRGHKKNRKNKSRKGRRTRSLADNVITLLESEHRESIMNAIRDVIAPDHELNGSIQDIEKVIASSAAKCKCNTNGNAE